jgi:putative aldouronate transport system permease protein
MLLNIGGITMTTASQALVRASGKKSSWKNELKKNFKKRKALYFMAIPGILFYLLFKYVPMYGIVVAFQRYSPYGGVSALWTSEFVGLQWFTILFSQPEIWILIRNTLTISFYFILFGFPAPIILSLLLNEVKNSHFKKLTQTVTYVPHFLSWAIVGGIIIQVLSPTTGIVNHILVQFGLKENYFLINPDYFRSIVVGVGIWKEVGWDSIIYLAAIAGIDPSLYEAAIVDGANRWKQITHITIPCIMPVMTVLLILSFGRIMETGFDEIYMLLSPSTYSVGDVFATYIYRVGIGRGQFSYATAIGLFQNAVNLIILVSVNKLSKVVTENSLW